MSRRPAFHAVTLDPDYTVLDGTRATEVPAGMLESLPGMLARLAPLFTAEREGVVVLTAPAAAALSLPAQLPRSSREAQDHPVLTGPRAAGWRVSSVSPWSTYWGEGRPAVHVAVHPWLTDRMGPLYDPDPFEMSWHCHRFHELCGGPMHGTPGVAGIGLLRDAWSGRGSVPYWQPRTRLPPGTRQAEADLIWSRRPPGSGPGYVHGYDANVMYLAAAGLTVLATGELDHAGAHRTMLGGDPDKLPPGYWRIEPWAWQEQRMPSPLGWRTRTRTPEPAWVTTPTLRLLLELAEQGAGPAPVLLDSWTAAGGRHLRGWADRLSVALRLLRDSTDPVDLRQVAAVKACYRETLGMLARDGSRVYRPDWRHAVIGTARANLWRKLWRVAMVEDRWPVEVRVDAVRYQSSSRDATASCPAGIVLGMGAGQFKIESTEEL